MEGGVGKGSRRVDVVKMRTRARQRERERQRGRETWRWLVLLQPECQLRNMAAVPGTAHFDFDSHTDTKKKASYATIKIFI